MRLRQLFEASYDGMIKNLRVSYPEQVGFIDDNLKWAKAVFKKDERIVWWLRQVTQHLKDPESVDLATMSTQLEHFMGYNAPSIQTYQFGKKTYDEIVNDLNALQQAYEQASNLKDPSVTPQEGDYELVKFNDGSSWWFVDRGYCEAEGKSGAHCGNITGKYKTDQRILSYRINNRVKMTFILEPDGKLGEMKGWGNQKPSAKFYPHIVSLLLDPMIKGIQGGGYLPDQNFSVFDLDDKNLQVINQQKPSLIDDQIKVSPNEALKAPAWIRKQHYESLSNIKGLSDIIDSNGEYNDSKESWDRAIDQNSELALVVPDQFISLFKPYIIDALRNRPRLMVTMASSAIRNDYSIASEFVKLELKNIGYILPTNPHYPKLCKEAIKEFPRCIAYLSPDVLTEELCEYAASIDGNILDAIPPQFMTQRVCMIAVSKNSNALSWVPEALKTQEMCDIAIQNDPMAYPYIPEKFKTGKMLVHLAKAGMLYAIPPVQRTPEFCKMSVSKRGHSLQDVPKEHITPELCTIAVNADPQAILYVPEKLLTQKLFNTAGEHKHVINYIASNMDHNKLLSDNPTLIKMAVEHTPSLIGSLPFKYRTPEMITTAVKKDGMALGSLSVYRDRNLKTPEVCEIAVHQNPRAIAYVPDNMLTAEMCKYALKQFDRHEIDDGVLWKKRIPEDVLQELKDKYDIERPRFWDM